MTELKTSIRHRIRSVILIGSTAVLILTATVFSVYELVTFRRSLLGQINSIATVIAANSSAALVFNNQEEAAELLSAIRSETQINVAALYDTDGKLFARYPAASDLSLPARAPEVGYDFDWRHLHVARPVIQKGRQEGTLYLRSDLSPMYARIRLYALIVLLVLVGSSLFGLGLSHLLQRRISEPIISLARIARRVSDQQDYTIRASKMTSDELGTLTDSFNHMLAQIQMRDEALRRNEERLRLALQGSQTGTWEWDLQHDRFHGDEYFYPLLGAQPNEVGSSQSFLNRVHPEDRQLLQDQINRALQDNKEFRAEFRVIWPDGTVHHLASRGKAFQGEAGQPARMMGVLIDITELKTIAEENRKLNIELEQRILDRTAELASTNRELEAFTYSVSHDLRAPLRHIEAYTQMLQEEYGHALAEEAHDYMARIRRGAQNMEQLVEDLLKLSRIGRQELNRLPVDLNFLLKDVLSELGPETKDRAIEWRVEQLPVIECDPGLIKQVFVNLLSNAVKYTRRQPAAVIEVGSFARGEDLVFFVRDNGVGFDMKFANKLFGVFQRLHRAEEFEGAGVGLATVERIIRKHGGRVWAEAEPGQGATFYFTLGRAAASAVSGLAA